MARPNFEVDPEKISETDGRDWQHWPGRVAAGKLLGVTPLQFRQMVREGEVSEFVAPDRSRRYDPDQLETLALELSEGKEPAEEMTVGGKPIEGMRAATDLLKQSQGHNERLLQQCIAGFEMTSKAMGQVIDFQQRTISTLTERLVKAEELANGQSLAEVQAAADTEVKLQGEARRTALVSAIAPHLGPILGRLSEAAERVLPVAKQGETVAPEPSVSSEPAAAPASVDGSMALDLLRRIGPDKLSLAIPLLSEEDQPFAQQVIEQLKERIQ